MTGLRRRVPLTEYTDAELAANLAAQSTNVMWSPNDIIAEQERRAARLQRRIAIATSIASVMVATAAVIISAIALLMPRV